MAININEINMTIIINSKQKIGEINREKIFFHASEETQRGLRVR